MICQQRFLLQLAIKKNGAAGDVIVSVGIEWVLSVNAIIIR